MHPEVVSDREGLCPKCGMRLVPRDKKTEAVGASESIDKHRGHNANIFKLRFWVSLFLSVPVVFYSEITRELVGIQAPVFPGSEYLPLASATLIFFYGGWIFISASFRELKARLPGMMTLISLAILVAYSYSVYVVFAGRGESLFWELSTLITIMLLGHWMEMRAVSGAQNALRELSKFLPDRAEVFRNGVSVIVPLSDLKVGDLALVRPGGKIPTDGLVEEGASDVNESIVTGESNLVAKKTGSEVIAGSTNGDGTIRVRVTNIGEKTFLAGVMRLVAEAQSSKSRLQMLSDRAAYYLTLIAVITGSLTLAVWLFLADPGFAVERMVAVLVVACPHALGLAIPLVASISTAKAARNGFLVKQRLALEAAKDIDVVLFDKTGTLTKGEFGVAAIISAGKKSSDEILKYAASVDSQSEHPIARAITAEAKKRSLDILPVKNAHRLPGKGSRAELNGAEIVVGNATLLTDRKLTVPPEAVKEIGRLSEQGKTIVYVIMKSDLVGAIALADAIRDESREAVRAIRGQGIKVAMITGDTEDVAKWVAGELGIDEYFAKVLPDKKSEKVKMLQERGQKVAMVGDGVNDAPALAQADLGIAIGAGTNVAIESAGIILVKNDPRDIPKIIRLSKLSYAKMIQNLFWATGYNVVAIPLAAGVLASQGLILQPALAAIFMSLSTVIVAINAVSLKNKTI